MGETIFIQTSLVAAFLAGMIALFAPCCVSYLLPAYLGSVFKERKKVLFMTFIYSLGIYIVIIPAVLGSKLISLALFRFHNEIYLTGGLFMILIGILTLLDVKLPMPKLKKANLKNTDVLSVLILGVFAGITSACCAPVLAGVLTLSVLSFNLWQSLLIGLAYVFGMVTPLYLGSYFIDSGKMLNNKFFSKKVFEIKWLSKNKEIKTSNLISFFIFTSMGILILYLVLVTDFSMAKMAHGFTKTINQLTLKLNTIRGIDFIFLVPLVLAVYLIIKKKH